jgi:hypothetical protein
MGGSGSDCEAVNEFFPDLYAQRGRVTGVIRHFGID